MTSRRLAFLSSLVPLLVFLVGGSCRTTYTDCAVRCALDGDCPSGLECSNGFCSSGAACDAAGGTGETAGGGGEANASGESGSAGSAETGGNLATGGSTTNGGTSGGGGKSHGGASSSGGSPEGGASGEAGTGGTGGQGGTAGAGGSGAEGGDGPWTPGDLSGLVLWLDAGSGVETTTASMNERVSAWRDRSGHGNDALQSEPPVQPTKSLDAANGLPALEFDGLIDFMTLADNETLRPGEQHFTLEVVTAWSNSITRTDDYWGYGILFTKQNLNYPFRGIGLLANTDDDTNTEARLSLTAESAIRPASAETNLNDNVFRLCGARRIAGQGNAPGAFEIRLNGASSATEQMTTSPNLDAPGESAYIGGQRGLRQQALDGFIAEIVFVRGDLSDQDLERLEGYLNQKYSLW